MKRNEGRSNRVAAPEPRVEEGPAISAAPYPVERADPAAATRLDAFEVNPALPENRFKARTQ
jgi:hypothetical protein